MTKSFSENYGYKQRKQIQFESMDDELRTSLWNAFLSGLWPEDKEALAVMSICGEVPPGVEQLWCDFLKRASDDMPIIPVTMRNELKDWFFSAEWNQVLDFLGFVYENVGTSDYKESFRNACNRAFEREASAYRFVGDEIAPVTNETEIREIEEVIDSSPLPGVREHIKTALSLFADRVNPDYRNSIKESISAVEGICKMIAGDEKTTLGPALKVVKDALGLHPRLEQGFSKIYGYASDADGIRHALMDEPNLSSEDARYMLVSCSAFVNYLTEKAQKAGVKL